MDQKGVAPALLMIIIGMVIVGFVGVFFLVVLPMLQNAIPTNDLNQTVSQVCGNGVTEGNEQCDDGNNNAKDACDNCVKTICGDFIINDDPFNSNYFKEQCDAKNAAGQNQTLGDQQCFNLTNSSEYSCNLDNCTCAKRKCDNDGLTELGEECDDGNMNNNDACTNRCKLTYCGDGAIQTPNGKGLAGIPPGFNEQCDTADPNADLICQNLLGDPRAKCRKCLCVPSMQPVPWVSCTEDSVLAWLVGKGSWAPGIVCIDDCALYDPDYACDMKTCKCARINNTVSCDENTGITSFFGVNNFDPFTEACVNDCMPWETCEPLSCICQPKEKYSCDKNTGANKQPNFGGWGSGAYDPKEDECVDDCPLQYICDFDSCECEKVPPIACTRNTRDTMLLGFNIFDPVNEWCVDDCPDDYFCDMIACLCQPFSEGGKKVVYCMRNTFEVISTDKNRFSGTTMVCKDDCPENYVCNVGSCTCVPEERETHKECNDQRKCVEVQGAGEDQCVDDSWCGRVVTPRCGDTYFSSPDKPGGGDEECEPSTTPPVLCPEGKVCHYCKCVDECPEYTYDRQDCYGECEDNEKCVLAATYLEGAPQTECYKCVAACSEDEYPTSDCNDKCGPGERCTPGTKEGCYKCRPLTGCSESQFYDSSCGNSCRSNEECKVVNRNIPCYGCVRVGCPSGQYPDQASCERECVGNCLVDEASGCFYCHGTICDGPGEYVGSNCDGRCTGNQECVKQESGCYKCQAPQCPDLWTKYLSASIHVTRSTRCEGQGEMGEICTTTCTLTSAADVIVKNIGTAQAGSSITRVVTTSGGQQVTSDTLETPALGAGQESSKMHSEKTYQKIVPGKTCPSEFDGPFQTTVTADSGGSVAECNENNNEQSVSPSTGG